MHIICIIFQLNIHGVCHQTFVERLLKKAENLVKVSFTYWTCGFAPQIVKALTTEKLEEFVMHVNGTNSCLGNVMKAFDERSKEHPDKTLKRIILILEDNFDLVDVASIEEVSKSFIKV